MIWSRYLFDLGTFLQISLIWVIWTKFADEELPHLPKPPKRLLGLASNFGPNCLQLSEEQENMYFTVVGYELNSIKDKGSSLKSQKKVTTFRSS